MRETNVNAFDVLRSPALPAIALVGLMLLMIFSALLLLAKAVFDRTVGLAQPASIGEFALSVFYTSDGWMMILWGNLIGLAVAIVVLALTVVSVPMLRDRTDMSAGLAIRTSIRAVVANAGIITLWGVVVAAMLILGCLPLFVGLAVAMPVLGHSTWHLYSKLAV